MSDQRNGGIAWTEQTWNPTRGCSRVSRGCEHCYAEGVARRFSGPGMPYEGLVRLDRDGKAKAQWNGVVRLVPEHLADPLSWRKPRKVFVNSMSDLFHESLAFADIAAIFGVMAACPKHTFQVLTKRPKRALEFFDWIGGRGDCLYAVIEARGHAVDVGTVPPTPWPLHNVWLGVSVEDQTTADERIPHLLACPAAVRWVSYEPALGPVDFTRVHAALGYPWNMTRLLWSLDALRGEFTEGQVASVAPLDWIVVGGESGPGARPFDLAWARSTIAQCREAGVAVFVKQLGTDPRGNGHDVRPMRVHDDGSPAPSGLRECRLHLLDRKGGDMSEWPEDIRVREFPTTKDTTR